MKTQLEQQIVDNMTKDPGNWKGMFYYNRKDPRLLVKKFDPLRAGLSILPVRTPLLH